MLPVRLTLTCMTYQKNKKKSVPKTGVWTIFLPLCRSQYTWLAGEVQSIMVYRLVENVSCCVINTHRFLAYYSRPYIILATFGHIAAKNWSQSILEARYHDYTILIVRFINGIRIFSSSNTNKQTAGIVCNSFPPPNYPLSENHQNYK